MDDFFAINAAKTEFRECFNLGDAYRVLAIADPDLVSFSDGQPSEFGASGLEALKTRLTNLFERFTAKLSVIVIEIRFQGDVAYDYGWHDLTLTPKDGGESIRRRYRYVDIWRRNKKGNWKLWMYMVIRTSPIRLAPTKFHPSERKFTEVSEAFCAAAC
jgi:ketosteroid isomerase-like protein